MKICYYSHSCSVMGLPGCNGLLLPCVELVLEDFEDLLLVGRLLLPVKVITGGSTAAGGTCTDHEKDVYLLHTVYLYSMLNKWNQGCLLFQAW